MRLVSWSLRAYVTRARVVYATGLYLGNEPGSEFKHPNISIFIIFQKIPNNYFAFISSRRTTRYYLQMHNFHNYIVFICITKIELFV